MIRRWSDTVYAGYVDDGGWFGRFVGCGSLAEAASYVEAATAGHKTRRRNARSKRLSETIQGSGCSSAPGGTLTTSPPDDLAPSPPQDRQGGARP